MRSRSPENTHNQSLCTKEVSRLEGLRLYRGLERGAETILKAKLRRPCDFLSREYLLSIAEGRLCRPHVFEMKHIISVV